MSAFIWVGIYFLGVFSVPNRKLGNGITAKPFKRWFKTNSMRYLMRYLLWWFITLLLEVFGIIPAYMFWIGAISFIMDDHFFGDDKENKKKWDMVRNKIKWLMELPAPPQEVRDVA